MSETYVCDAIAATIQHRPRIRVSIRVDHWRQLSQWLLAGELDFYVADVGDAAVDSRFHYTSLPPQNFVWFCRTGHPLVKRRKKQVSRNDRLRFPLATPKMPPWAIEWLSAAFAEVEDAGRLHPFPAIECESYAMLKRLVTSSDCVSAALQQTLSDELDDGSLIVLPMDAPQLTTHAGIVRRSDRTPSATAAALISRIEHLAQG